MRVGRPHVRHRALVAVGDQHGERPQYQPDARDGPLAGNQFVHGPGDVGHGDVPHQMLRGERPVHRPQQRPAGRLRRLVAEGARRVQAERGCAGEGPRVAEQADRVRPDEQCPAPPHAVEEIDLDQVQQRLRLQRRARRQGGLGSADQPSGPRPGLGRQFGRPGQERGAGRVAAAGPRPVGRPFHLIGDPGVRTERGGGPVPGPHVGVGRTVGHPGQHPVRPSALHTRRAAVHRGPHQRVPEGGPGPQRHEPGGLGRARRLGTEAEQPGRVREVPQVVEAGSVAASSSHSRVAAGSSRTCRR